MLLLKLALKQCIGKTFSIFSDSKILVPIVHSTKFITGRSGWAMSRGNVPFSDPLRLKRAGDYAVVVTTVETCFKGSVNIFLAIYGLTLFTHSYI